MTKDRSIFANGAFASLQVLWTTGILFVVYRIATQQAGVELLGLWSGAVAVSALAALADCGSTDLMVRQIAEARGNGRLDRIRSLFTTLQCFAAISVALAAIAITPITVMMLESVVPEGIRASIWVLVGSACATVWINTISVGLFGVLEAFGRYDIKLFANVCNGLATLICALFAIPQAPVVGLALTFVLGASIGMGIALVACVVLLRSTDRSVANRASITWVELRSMIAMGIQVRLAGVFLLGLEPVTRLLLTRFAGLEAVGLYELAYRAVFQFRSLVVSALQVLVPGLAAIRAQNPERAKLVLSQATYQAVVIGLPAFALIVCVVPFLSIAMLSRFDWELARIALLLAIAWSVNMLAAPAYFANLVVGNVRSNSLAHFVICLVNVILGWMLGSFFGELGVVCGTSLAILAGSMVTLMSRRHTTLRAQFVLTNADWTILLGGVACVAAVYALWASSHSVLSIAVSAAALLAAYGLVVMGRVFSELRRHRRPDSIVPV